MLYQPGEFQNPPARLTWRTLRNEWIKPGLTVLTFMLLMNLFFPRYMVEGKSMEPNLHETERLFVSNVDAMTGSLIRGEVVVAISPVGEISVVKRLIGLPGERIEVRGGAVYINGVALDEPYLSEPPHYTGEWQLGDNEYFLLGDNRNHSLDSHTYGPIPASRLRGVVKFRFWPLNELSVFPAPDYAP